MKKKKLIKKKSKKPVTKKQSTEIVVRVEGPNQPVFKASEFVPEKKGTKYMIEPSWISEKQVIRLVQQTDPKYIFKRKAKGGGMWDYVPGWYIEKVLNYAFGWNWDFEVTSHGKEADQVWVLGKLTVKDDDGHTIVKTQFGRADIKFKKDTKIMLDFGNDLKAATTDSLKKCASLLGIASDIYGKAETRDNGGKVIEDQTTTTPPAETPTAPASKSDKPEGEIIECSNCGQFITAPEREYSKKIFKKQLCRSCQSVEKNK